MANDEYDVSAAALERFGYPLISTFFSSFLKVLKS